jgi:hypothetical protein
MEIPVQIGADKLIHGPMDLFWAERTIEHRLSLRFWIRPEDQKNIPRLFLQKEPERETVVGTPMPGASYPDGVE